MLTSTPISSEDIAENAGGLAAKLEALADNLVSEQALNTRAALAEVAQALAWLMRCMEQSALNDLALMP